MPVPGTERTRDWSPSIAPPGARPALKIVSSEVGKNAAGAPIAVLTVENDSAAHGYLSQGRLRIVQKDASGREIFARSMPGPEIQQTIGFGLIAPGQRRKVAVPIVLPAEGGTIDAQFTPETRR